MFKNSGVGVAILAVSSSLMMASTATALTVKVSIQNIAPSNGLVVTPLWVGFHDGSFDYFNLGQQGSTAVERLAEDANAGPLASDFLASGAGIVEGRITGAGLGPGTPPVIPPGTITSQTFNLDASLPSSRYFSYGAMIVPSNDAFIGNDNPLAFRLFDNNGNFVGADFVITGDRVWDAGSEDNDEIPVNTGLLGQTTSNTGSTTIGAIVTQHPGFIPGGNIETAFPGTVNFTNNSSYQVARIRVEEVPEPATILGALTASGLLALGRRFKKKAL